jgi:hypothetical protein
MSYGGYADTGRALTEHFGRPFGRGQIELWHRRGTKNHAGEPFPEPAYTIPDALPRQPRKLFDSDQVIAWVSRGIPGPHGDGWLDLTE